MLRKKIRRLVKTSLLLVLLFLALILLSNFLIQQTSVQNYLIGRLSDATGFHIRAHGIVLNLWRGVGIFVHGLEASSSRGTGSITASKVRVIFDAGQLIRGRIVPVRLYLIQPRMELSLPEATPGPGPAGAPSEKGPPLFWIPELDAVSIDNGRVDFRDRPFGLENLFFDARRTGGDPLIVMVTGRGDFRYQGEKTSFRLTGPLSQDLEKRRPPSLALALETGKIPLAWISWPDSLPFRGGELQARLKIDGSLEMPLSVDGRVTVGKPRFSIHGGDREKGYSLEAVSLDFRSLLDAEKLTVPALQLRTEGLSLALALELDLKERADPYLKLEVKGPFMDLGVFKGLFPTPLLPPWLEDRLFPILRKGDVQLNGLSLKGRLNQFRALGRPENRSVLAMSVGCRNFEVFGQGIEVPFREVSAEVRLEKGDFRVSGLNASWGTSRIRESGFVISGIAGEKPAFEFLVDGSFDLQDLMRQKGMDIIPPDVLQKLEQMEPLSGKLECRATIRYEHGWEFPRTEKGRFLFRDVLVEQKDLRFPLSLEKADLIIDESGENRFEGKGAWGNSAFQARGVFGKAEQRFPVQWANVLVDMDMNEVISLIYRGGPFPLTFADPLPCKVYITRVKDEWSCQGSIDLEGVVLETNRFVMDPPGGKDKIFFDLDFRPPGWVDLKEILCEFGGSSLRMTGSYSLKSRDMFTFDLSAPSLAMEDLGIRFQKGGEPAGGLLNCRLNLRVFPQTPLETTVTGVMKGKNLFLDSSRFPSPIRDCDFTWDFSGKKVSIPLWRMTVGKSPLLIRGELKGWDGVTGSLLVNSDFVDSGDFLAKGEKGPSARPETGLERFLEKSQIHLALDILRGRWRRLEWGPLKADLDYMGRNLYLRHVTAHMGHGRVDLAGHIKSRKEPEILLSSHVKFNDQPVRALLEGLGLEDRYLEGALTMEALLFMKGRTRKDLIPGMVGSANILVKEGLIEKSNVLLRVLDFLSLQKIFKKRPPELDKEGFYFESIGGHAEIERGVLTTENGVMKSPVLNAVASGEVDLVEKTLALNLGVQPLETIDTLVSSIPVLGHILAGKDKTLLTYYFTAKGPLKNPEVEYVPFKNMGSGAAGVLKRLFLTPVKLFKDLTGIMNRGDDPEERQPEEGPQN
jgi:hypothetical protein